jgi:hypothetical protein
VISFLKGEKLTEILPLAQVIAQNSAIWCEYGAEFNINGFHFGWLWYDQSH